MVFDATQNRNGINNKLKSALDLGRSQISKLFLSLFCLRIFFIIFVFWFREVSDTLTISVTLSFSYFLYHFRILIQGGLRSWEIGFASWLLEVHAISIFLFFMYFMEIKIWLSIFSRAPIAADKFILINNER